MPPRRSTRAQSREAEAVLGSGAAVQDEMPPLPSRFVTTYGSELSHTIHNPRRGHRRDILGAIQDAQEDEEEDLTASSPHPAPDPEPEPEPETEAAPRHEHEHESKKIRESQPKRRQQKSARTSRKSPHPQSADISADSGQTSTQPTYADLLTQAVRGGSQGAHDSSRSFGNESSLFRDATVDSPSRLPSRGRPDAGVSTILEEPSEEAGSAERSLEDPLSGLPLGNRRPGRNQDRSGLPASTDSDQPLGRPPIQSSNRQASTGYGLRQRREPQKQPRGSGERASAPISSTVNPDVAGTKRRNIETGRGVSPSPQIGRRWWQWPPSSTPEDRARNGRVDTRVPRARSILSSIIGLFDWLAARSIWLAPFVLWMILMPKMGKDTHLGAYHWYGWSDMSHNIGQFIPIHIGNPLGDENAQAYLSELRRLDYDMALLKRSKSVHEEALAKLEKVIPDTIQMERRNGKLVVSQDFYHALLSLMKSDPSILTFDKTRGGYELTSDDQALPIRNWLARQGVRLGGKGDKPDGPDIDRAMAASMGKTWEAWVKNNRGKIQKEIVPGDVVTKAEFIRHIKTEFAAHRSEVKAEIKDLQPRLEQLVRDTVKAATKTTPQGLTQAEASKLVRSIVRKAVADAQLEALAKGQIAANWDAELKHRVNYFAPGAGARRDPQGTSPTFQKKDAKLKSKAWRDRWKVPPSFELEMALAGGWVDSGDCWCGAVTTDRRGRSSGTSLGVLLGQTIIPQYVVVEHILPGATLEPDARPKDIEVWAAIEEVGIRGRLQDMAAVKWPQDLDGGRRQMENSDGFVKIGQFTYESSEATNGVHVYQLPEELLAMEAETSQIRIFAVSNYGSKEKTCFYRVRLFGKAVPEPY